MSRRPTNKAERDKIKYTVDEALAILLTFPKSPEAWWLKAREVAEQHAVNATNREISKVMK